MADVKKLKSLQKKLKKLGSGTIGENSVTVGYTQNYALYVHENRAARHKKGKVAGYLLDPANEKAQDISRRIEKVTVKTNSLEMGLLQGGLLLQRISQKLVPIDTGALKASAFTSLTSQANTAAARAHATSQTVKAAAKNKKKKKD